MISKFLTKTVCVVMIVSLLLPVVGYELYSWQNSDVNYQSKLNIYDSIYQFPHQTVHLNSMTSNFDVNYVANASPDALNPYFPAIHISAAGEHNAWLHAVYTDANCSTLKQFVDTSPKIFPWYSLNQDFYDAPHWRYTLVSKPLSFWRGHAYAVQVDHEHKTIKCIGGVLWGFELSYFRLRPIALEPQALSVDDWYYDWNSLFKKTLDGYSLE